jgi:hypothetical protein
MSDFDRLLQIKNQIGARLFNPPQLRAKAERNLQWLAGNLVGLGVGAKIKDGHILDEPALTAFVRAKLPAKTLGDFLFATQVKDLGFDLRKEETDVVEVGTLNSAGGPEGPVYQVTVGTDVSIAGREIHGTICAFVKRYDCDDRIFLLSSGHVLDGRGGLFRFVASRGAVVAEILCPKTDQGTLLQGAGMPGYPQLDGVIAHLVKGVEPNFRLPGNLGRLTREPIPARLRMPVKKAGKTIREGDVVHTDVLVMIDYPTQSSFVDHQIIVFSRDKNVFAQEGDSGSLVIHKVDDRSFAVGMVIAAGSPARLGDDGNELRPCFTVVTPMTTLLEAFHARLEID